MSTYAYDAGSGSSNLLTTTAPDGAITDRYSYSPYGELTNHDGQYASTFLFNGQYGVMDDGDGLLYMRTRYYAPELLRFVNADVLEGSIGTSVTLNRYAYANGNPVSYLDPFGRSAVAARTGHAVLDGAGLIPVAGMVFDAVNGVWYAVEGDWGNAGLSALGFIPV